MKVPVSWLREFVDLPTEDPGEIEAVFAQLGHEVDGIERIDVSFDGVVVAKVVEVGPHPNADRIRLCRVDDGTETQDVVCGAWNFERGAIIAYAPVGSRLGIDTDDPLELTAKELRGVTSNGMIASARELGLGDEHDGIMVLDDLGMATESDVGRSVAELLPYPDVVFDVSITPNRGDCMSVLGLARELAAHWHLDVREPDISIDPVGEASTFAVDIDDPHACPRFVAQEVADVTIGPSPLWMQLRLIAAGQRPISNVVDVSNYVMLELGHPIHTFDADTIRDQRLTIRRAGEGQSLTTLDGVTRMLESADIVVADSSGAIALAGVMGGSTTEVTDATTRVLVEAAHWDPPSILLTSHRLGLRSEASARFERGVDPNLSQIAAARASKLVAVAAGGAVCPNQVDSYPEPITPSQVTITGHHIRRLLGPQPDTETSATFLTRLGFGVERSGEDEMTVSVPTRRPDVTRPADLVEEIARMHGYESFPDRVRRGRDGSLTPGQAAARALRATMVGAGFSEAQTLSFVGQSDLDLLQLPDGDARRVGIRVSNPLRDEEGTMRTTLLPGLGKAVAANVGRGIADVALFETGRVFIPDPSSSDHRIPHQPETIAFVAVGQTGIGGMHGSARPADVFTATGIVSLIGTATGHSLEIRQERPPVLHPGRAAGVFLGEERIGFVGELHPAIARGFGLSGRVAVGELEATSLLEPVPDWKLQDVSDYPPAVFDLAFIVDTETPAGELAATIRAAAGAYLESAAVFDEFVGDSIGNGRKSIAVRLTFRALDRTLTDDEMVPVREAIVDAVSIRHQGELRGAS